VTAASVSVPGARTPNTLTTDVITFGSVTGQKLGDYNLTGDPTIVYTTSYTLKLTFALATANYYFGGKQIGKFNGSTVTYVGSDRLGSFGKYYPWGQEKPSATGNNTEKFTGYFRDSETGLDYADQRYHQPGMGRFVSADQYQASAGPRDPGSWNRYAYVGGDPINFKDPRGNNCLSVAPRGQASGCEFCDPYSPGWDCCEYLDTCDYPPGRGGGGDDDPSVGLTDQREGGGIQQGSPSFALAADAMGAAQTALWTDFMGLMSVPCEADLAAVGVTNSEISAGALYAFIVNGMTQAAGSTYAQDAYGNSAAYNAAVGRWGTISMAQYMTLVAPNAAAVAQLNGNTIYINAAWVNGMGVLDQQAMLLHELLHNITGLTDDAIQSALGLSTAAASQNIGDKLRKDCLQ